MGQRHPLQAEGDFSDPKPKDSCKQRLVKKNKK
jgi:hypothetical protein